MPSPRVAEFAPVQAPEPEPLPLPIGDTEPVGELSIDAPDSVVPAAAADDVFSRIRRTREANLARAEEVLSSALFTPRVDEAVEAESAVVAVAMPTPESATMQRSAVVAEDRVGAVVADDTDHFAARESALASVQTQIGRKIKRLLADEQNDVLDLVRRAPGTTVHDEVLPLLGDHVGRYVAAIGGELLIAVGAGASFFGAGVGGDAADLAALDRCVGDELVVPLRVLLQRALSDDPGSDEILDRVRAAYREVKGQRVDEAARTIACASFNAGIEAALVGQQVRWAVDPVRGCSPDCDDNALEGPVDIGTAFPTGATRPPGHLGCRCLLVPAQQ